MKKGNAGVIILIVVAAIGGFIVLGNIGKQQSSLDAQKSQGETQDQESAQNSRGSSNEFSTRFLSYSEENLKKATENEGKAVVFFHASWCPTCSEAENDLQTNFDKVPKDVTILKTDYDTSEHLKTKYGIVTQDTWVQVDANGNEIAKWNSGGQGVSSLLANLK